MKRLFGLMAALCATAGALLAALGLPAITGSPGSAVASAATPAQQIGMRILLITDGTDCTDANATASGIAYCDWVNTLDREGVPHDSVVTNSASVGSVPLPALSSTAADGTQVANYQGVVVATSGTQGLSTAQWATLQTFEQHFSVRQVTAYAVPSSDYGLSTPSPAGGEAMSGTTAISLTQAGQQLFPYLNTVSLDTGTYGYPGTALPGANVNTLIAGPGNSSLLGIYTSSDGRQTMYQSFNENQYMLQSELLRHGELDWLARNTYFGDQRNYLETDVDDNFLSDDTWSIATHSTDFTPGNALREVPADVVKAAAWSTQNNFRIDMLFNGGGSVAVANGESLVGAGDSGSGGTGSTTGTTSSSCTTTTPCPDPLLTAFTATDPSTGKPYTSDFGWISHTWDHPNIDEGCATQNYIEAELNQNTAWGTKAAGTGTAAGNPLTGGLGLTSSTDPTTALGNDNPQVIITGEHSGLANLLPGNPGQVDPPALDTAAQATTTGGTLAAGDYVYAVTDQFNTALPGAPAVAGTGESAGSISAPVTVTAPNNSVTLTWGAVCHAAQYNVYRAPFTPTTAGATTGTIGAWTLLAPAVLANTSTDFTNPASTSDTANGGPVQKTFTDTGLPGSPTGSTGTATATSRPASEGAAVESAYEQNPVLDAAFAATTGGGIKYFGSDASKPYPTPSDGTFTTGSYTGTTVLSGGSFQDAGGTAIPRYPTNIYYNVSTNAQEVDEYQTLYDSPTCKPVTGVTTCNPAGTPFTITQIVASVDQNMFLHMMGNDPRPNYFHQTNLMSQTTGSVNGQGDGLFYETLNPLLAQYHQYFAGNAPIEQPTMAQIGTLLTEQGNWAAAKVSQVTGSIEGNVVTVDNTELNPVNLPLTGTTGGTPYAGTQSYWTAAPVGTSTYTALAAWPAPPTVPVKVTPPTGPAPGDSHDPLVSPGGGKPSATATYFAVQAAPKTVGMRKGNVIISLTCKASFGKTAQGKLCSGTFTLKVAGHTLRRTFRFKSGKVDRITLKLTGAMRASATAAAAHKPKKHKLTGRLVITTNLSPRQTHVARGTLTIRT